MAASMFRYTIIGEALDAAIKEVQEKYGSGCVSNDAVERIMTKFDDVAAKVFCSEDGNNERGKPNSIATITATEHEFKFNEGVWKFVLKGAKILIDSSTINVEGLKVIACNSDNQGREGRRRNNQRSSRRNND